MTKRYGRSLGLAVLLAAGACSSGPQAADAPVASQTAPSDPGATPTVQDIWAFEPFAPLEPGTYFIDPDLDPSTPLRVVYEVPAEGWSMWIGAPSSATLDTSA